MLNTKCRTNDECKNQHVDAICIGNCCCTSPKTVNSTTDIPPIAQPLHDSPQKGKGQKNLAQSATFSLTILTIFIFVFIF